jgi:hypothetical protein
MQRVFVHLARIVGAALVLAGCGLADSRSPVPEFMRNKAAEPPPLEAAPEVKRLVRENLDSLFSTASKPRNVRVSPPYREVRGPGWTACVRADILSVVGKPLSMTYRIIISRGQITDRRRAEGDDTCASETYEPI